MKNRLRAEFWSYPGCAGNVELKVAGSQRTMRLMRLANMLPAIAPVAVLSVVKAVGPDEAERFRVASNLGSFDL